MQTAENILPADSGARLLTVIEVIKRLQISQTALYALIKRKHHPIPSVRIGKSRRFPSDKLQSWINELGK